MFSLLSGLQLCANFAQGQVSNCKLVKKTFIDVSTCRASSKTMHHSMSTPISFRDFRHQTTQPIYSLLTPYRPNAEPLSSPLTYHSLLTYLPLSFIDPYPVMYPFVLYATAEPGTLPLERSQLQRPPQHRTPSLYPTLLILPVISLLLLCYGLIIVSISL